MGVAAGLALAKAGGAGVAYAVRAGRAERRGEPLVRDVPNPAPTAGLAAAVAIDELFTMPMGVLSSIFPSRQYEQSSAELDDAVRFYDAHGWLDDPSGYFAAPSPLESVDIETVRRRRGPIEVLRFASEFQPHPGEPGGDRWRSFEANQDAFAVVLRHEGGPRPWLVCLHGAGMGRRTDVDTFHMRKLHRELGVNVVLPVLPLHGPRRAGMGPDKMFVSNVHPVNNVLGLAQSIWDLRRLLGWLREQEGATAIGVYGFSLGSYVTSLLATIEEDLACVIAVVPAGDLAEALRAAEPVVGSKRLAHRGVFDWRSALAHRVVSPLARPCLVPKERRFIIAGQGDRVAPPPGAVLLWRHWDEPSIRWQPTGHLTARLGDYDAHLSGILRNSGVAHPTSLAAATSAS